MRYVIKRKNNNKKHLKKIFDYEKKKDWIVLTLV